MDKRTTGLFNKFNVTRTDGTDAPGGKHEGCEYFVLDLTHDPFAMAAIRAYADACRKQKPALAADLDAKAPATASRTLDGVIQSSDTSIFNGSPSLVLSFKQPHHTELAGLLDCEPRAGLKVKIAVTPAN